VELVTTALFMYQGLPALGVLGPAGWQVHGFGHDAVFSGVVKPGEDRPPAQYRQEFVALIDAAAQLRQMQAQPPSIFLA